MTPNRQNPAHALFARRPIVPHTPDVLAADPTASQELLPPSGTRATPVIERPLPAPAAPIPSVSATCRTAPVERLNLSRLRIKIRKQHTHCTGGCGPQILSAFVKQRTYQPLPIGNSTHRSF